MQQTLWRIPTGWTVGLVGVMKKTLMALALLTTPAQAATYEVTCEGVLFGNHNYLTLTDKKPECTAEVRTDYPELQVSGPVMRRQVLSVCRLERPCRIKGVVNIGIADGGYLWVRVDKVVVP